MKQKKIIVAMILATITSMAAAQLNNSPEGGNDQSNGRHQHTPPQAAIDACKEKASGDACSFVGHENKTRSGTCFAPSAGNSSLVCRPNRRASGMGGNEKGE